MGLIQQQMDPAAEEAIPVPPGAEQVATPEGDQGPEPSAEDDPAFRDALKYAMQALYENNGADGVARALQASPNAQTLCDTAYKMVEVVDERTGANVPEELLAVLAMQILKEVVDIGEAAGVTFKPSEIALAFRDMILRYVEESGYDASQLRAAMDEVDPAQFDAMAAEPEDAEEPGEPPEGTPADAQEDAAEGEPEEEEL